MSVCPRSRRRPSHVPSPRPSKKVADIPAFNIVTTGVGEELVALNITSGDEDTAILSGDIFSQSLKKAKILPRPNKASDEEFSDLDAIATLATTFDSEIEFQNQLNMLWPLL